MGAVPVYPLAGFSFASFKARDKDSYDSFKYDDILKTEVYDYVKIRGDAGIVNQNISDLVVDGGRSCW